MGGGVKILSYTGEKNSLAPILSAKNIDPDQKTKPHPMNGTYLTTLSIFLYLSKRTVASHLDIKKSLISFDFLASHNNSIHYIKMLKFEAEYILVLAKYIL